MRGRMKIGEKIITRRRAKIGKPDKESSHLHPNDSIDEEEHDYEKSHMRQCLKEEHNIL